MVTYRAYYTKKNLLKYLSHLDMINLIQRAIFSTDAKVSYSKGFNPHPIMSFANPLPLGVSSDMEIFEFRLEEEIDEDLFLEDLNSFLPKDIQIKKIFKANGEDGINNIFKYSIYNFTVFTDIRLDDISLDLTSLIQTRERKQKKSKEKITLKEDIGKYILSYTDFEDRECNEYFMSACLQTNHDKTINPLRFMKAIIDKYGLSIPLENIFIHKKEMTNG